MKTLNLSIYLNVSTVISSYHHKNQQRSKKKNLMEIK